MARSACSVRGAMRDPRSACSVSTSPSFMPASRSGRTTSVRYHSVSVSAIRRKLSPQPRSHRSMTTGRSRPTVGARSPAPPTARLREPDLPVVARRNRGPRGPLSGARGGCRSVRSDGERWWDSGRQIDRTHSPPGMRTRGLRSHRRPHPVERHPGQLQAVHPTHLPCVSRELSTRPAGPQYPDRNQPVDIVRFDSGPSGHLLAPFLDHGRPDPRCRSRHQHPSPRLRIAPLRPRVETSRLSVLRGLEDPERPEHERGHRSRWTASLGQNSVSVHPSVIPAVARASIAASWMLPSSSVNRSSPAPSVRPRARARKEAIWSRRTGSLGQNSVVVHP